MKKKKSLRFKLIATAISILAIIGIVYGVFYVICLNTMLQIGDVMTQASHLAPYFIPFILVIFVAEIITDILNKKGVGTPFLVNGEACVSLLLVLIVTANFVCYGPLNTVLNSAFIETRNVEGDVKEIANTINKQTAEEGSVLLKNDNQSLPLDSSVNKINVFGWNSVHPFYSGGGSGSSTNTDAIDILQGLQNNGFETNDELSDIYAEYTYESQGGFVTDWTLPQPTMDYYTDEIMTNAKEFSDTAMLVIGRCCGESAEAPMDMCADDILYYGNEGDFEPGQHYLELSNTEKQLVELVNENFSNIIVVINSANAMELGWLEEYDNINSALLVSAPGSTGFEALGEILNGSVNPSAKLSDTYVYDLTTIPAFNYSGSNTQTYDNVTDTEQWKEYVENNPGPVSFGIWDQNINFVTYVEGIYVGYKFYETADAEGTIDYDATVQYPFGYGLSYTTFEQEISNQTTDSSGNISFDVTVKNTGDVAGKDVVEVYFTPPYYNGGIEKAEVNLIDFGKTETLNAGESQTMSFTINQEDLASYDTNGEGCYVLDDGKYEFSIRSDSHTVLDSFQINIEDKIIYNEDSKRSSDQEVADNKFEFAEGDFTYLSRADQFANYEEATAAPTDLSMSEEDMELFYSSQEVTVDDSDEMPTTGEDNGIKLEELRSLDYDDEKWNDFLDQMEVDEMCSVIDTNGFFTKEISNLGIKATINSDGPAGFKMLTNATVLGPSGAGEIMTACTWNKKIAEDFGENMGDQAKELGISGWYGPALNIHRTAFSGRNYEYFSEDTILSAKLVAEEIKAAQEKGVICYAKHFALNDQETHRWDNLCTYSNEQAIRETYLKVFEAGVKEGGATGIMSSYNCIGPVWTGICEELLTDVLRGEWGFNGNVVTDYNGNQSPMDADVTIRAGGDSQLTTTEADYASIDDRTSATAVKAIRNATHNMLYSLVNSNAYEDGAINNSGLKVWEKGLYAADVIAALVIVLLEVTIILKSRKKEVKVVEDSI
ncbi:MAG: glycoside hydrolase family 3 C-terminal domain-containing protein [Hespellia sp.]|nr:glycoside hydrolase family 3 C-terminal domain-containing protein [Hespellia sp.]